MQSENLIKTTTEEIPLVFVAELMRNRSEFQWHIWYQAGEMITHSSMCMEDNVNPRSPRNLIPLCGTHGAIGSCHHLFDYQAIALMCNPLKQGYGLHCFTPNEWIKEYQEVALIVPHSYRPYKRVLNARAKACLKDFVGENFAAEISTLKSVTSLLACDFRCI